MLPFSFSAYRKFMSDTPSFFGFELARRGYDRDQVDSSVAQLLDDRDNALCRLTALERRVEELVVETDFAEAQDTGAEPSYAALGPRIEEILRLAVEEAQELSDEARETAEREHEIVAAAADRMQAEANAFAADLNAASDRECARLVQTAQYQASELRATANAEASATQEKADAFFEDARSNAAQAAADFEVSLAKRRDRAERELASRQAKAEARLAEIQCRAEQLRLEAEQIRTDSERRAHEAKQTAQRQFDDIVAEANSKAVRIRSASERELAALANRRDSINAQLTNVRAMLATLTGAGGTAVLAFGDAFVSDSSGAAP